MNKILNVYKPIGMTPLQLIEKVRIYMPELKDEKIGYAGRLDPLAHGVMVLMVGEATKERDKYLGLTKKYEFEVLFGVDTDTYDALGLLETKDLGTKIVKENVKVFVSNHSGKLYQLYPPYSSKTVYGKPLFWYARNNKLSEITMPERAIEIFSFELLSFGETKKNVLQKKIEENISLVQGDFRQSETKKRWDDFFQNTVMSFQTARLLISCSSGTYVRGVIHEMGKEFGCGAIALEILRTQVGNMNLKESIRLHGVS